MQAIEELEKALEHVVRARGIDRDGVSITVEIRAGPPSGVALGYAHYWLKKSVELLKAEKEEPCKP